MNTQLINTPTVKVVSFLGHPVRIANTQDGVSICSKDAHAAAGLNKYRDSFANLPQWCTRVSIKLDTLLGKRGSSALDPLPGRKGGAQWMQMLSPAGLYYLFLRSRKPQAVRFARWICEEVIPAISTRGFYALPGIELTAGERKIGQQMERLAACRTSLTRTTRPEGTWTISEFMHRWEIATTPAQLMRAARRAWCACGQRRDLPRVWAGASRFPVLYPEAVLRDAFEAAVGYVFPSEPNQRELDLSTPQTATA